MKSKIQTPTLQIRRDKDGALFSYDKYLAKEVGFSVIDESGKVISTPSPKSADMADKQAGERQILRKILADQYDIIADADKTLPELIEMLQGVKQAENEPNAADVKEPPPPPQQSVPLDIPAPSAGKVDLDEMTKKEIGAYISETYGTTLDLVQNKASLIAAAQGVFDGASE